MRMVGVEGVLTTQEITTIITWILDVQKMNLLFNIQLKLKVAKNHSN
jgi:hypothetical protein